jgi:hypothetical protein
LQGYDPDKVAETLGAAGLLKKDASGKLSRSEPVLVTAHIFDDDRGE